nr:ribonuclease H-like domain-containing protein [Tanacetum cinerariifolium]
MHKAFPLPAIKFPLPEELPTTSEDGSHCQKKRDATARKIVLLSKTRGNCQSKKDGSYTKDPYEVHANDPSTTTTNTTSGEAGTKSGRTVTLTTEDIQKKKNDVKARTTLLLSLPEVKQDDLNQKFLTSLAPEWLMHTIVWRNKSDLDTMSLDDLYNHLKDINQIDENDMEEMDIKWNMELLSMRADKFWKRTGKKISIQGSDVAGAPRSQDRGRRDNFRHESKAEEQAPKALMAINRVGWDWSYMPNDGKDHALVADEEAPTEFALMANTCTESKKDLSWTGLPECADDTVTDYSRPSPTVKSSSEEDQNRNPSVSKNVASPSTPKPFVKFAKASDSQCKSKTDEKETHKKPP